CLYKGANGTTVATDSSRAIILRDLGLDNSTRFIFFVEDRASREFARLWLNKNDAGLANVSEIIDVGSESSITSICKAVPAPTKDVRLIALYDADSRNRVISAKPKRNKVDHKPTHTKKSGHFSVNGSNTIASCFLPGTLCIEEEFREATATGIKKLSESLGRTSESVEVCLSSLRGKEKHDWLEDLVKILDVQYSTLMHFLFEIWLEHGNNRELSNSSFSELRSFID
ncbi:MAG: hypothetical protein HQL41_00500, partial [Alphaproteobacteria bacterium]|nr:hypothetical protein [Alphaproteobacteria bacterium]